MPSRVESLAIVAIAGGHAASFHACLDAVAREGLYLAQTEAPPPERVEAFVREGIQNGVAQFVALDADQVVGWADIFPAWPQSTRHRGTVGMGVLAAWRGHGLGERLLRACLGAAAARGITRVELEVRADNTRAIRLYERLGFAHEARLARAVRVEGRYQDSLQMSLLLPD
jgi:ribosomal protein S18 acetylase RimI-like enzyme